MVFNKPEADVTAIATLSKKHTQDDLPFLKLHQKPVKSSNCTYATLTQMYVMPIIASAADDDESPLTRC
jgi:hypothetical protein